MMYCSACGQELHDKALICPKCGVGTANYENSSPLSKSEIIGFYIVAVVIPAIGFWLGLYTLFRRQIGHGVGIMITSFIFICLWYGLWFDMLPELTEMRAAPHGF